MHDVSLNAKGVRQAQLLRQVFRRKSVDIVYSSDLKRCTETAKIVFSDKPLHKRKGLREIDFGLFSGKTYIDVERLYPEIYNDWLTSPQKIRIPGGETLLSLKTRVTDSFERIAAKKSHKVVALVTHGGPIRIILLLLLKKGLDKFWEIEQDTTAFNVVDLKRGRPHFATVNNTKHLKGLRWAD